MSQKRVHFMGIGGSGMSAVAQIAHHLGYKVNGCDLSLNTPYINMVTKLGIQVSEGHLASHLNDIDILAVTPAVFYQNNNHEEVAVAKQTNKLMTWQSFMGKFLHLNKTVICIAGTHGKSTTTSLAGILLEQAGLDPIVEVGATVPHWKSNIRLGSGKFFISEADEFHDNFQNYSPDIIILNNIEMDHPEFFISMDRLYESFTKFANNLKPSGTLIYNADNSGNQELVKILKNQNFSRDLIPYSIKEFPSGVKLQIPGIHNKSNAMGIIKLGQLLKIPNQTIYQTLSSFKGISRRIELIGEKRGIKIYDDYANHPTAFKASIQAIKEQNPNSKIIVVIEPHTFSRLKAVINQLAESVSQADKVIVTKIYASRETDPGNFTGIDIVSAMHHPESSYIESFQEIETNLKNSLKPTDCVLVMGSGDSYKFSRSLLNNL